MKNMKISMIIEDFFEKNPVYIWAVLLLVFAFDHFRDIMVLGSFPSAIFPLNALYLTNTLLFKNGGINHGLAHVLISPSNNLFIYPPGIYLLIRPLLHNLKDIYTCLFVIQLFVPILTYIFISRVTRKVYAFYIALISIFCFTNVNWLAPDLIIQPIMLGAAILLANFIHVKGVSMRQLAGMGFLTGIIMIFKHNIGVFFAVMCGTVIFFKSIEEFSGNERSDGQNRLLLFFMLASFLGFGIFFGTKLIFFDEFLFYLVPYFAFWGLTIYMLLADRSFGLDAGHFFKRSALYTAFLLPLPLTVFLWVGGEVGYLRYWHSLFGMGLKYLPIWDYGICQVASNYVKFMNFLSFKNLYGNTLSVIMLVFFLLPFCVNFAANTKLLSILKNRKIDPAGTLKAFEVTSVGIMAMFMFFPLEGIHILITKLFLFLYVLLYVFKKSFFIRRIFVFFLILLVMAGCLRSASRFIKLSGMHTISAPGNIKEGIGMPVERSLGLELSRQIDVIRNTVTDDKYYVIDSSGATLTSLLYLVNNRCPQYYTEMRKGILSQDVVEAVVSGLRSMPFVVVNYDDYERYCKGMTNDPFLRQILNYVNANFSEVASYKKPPTEAFKNNFCSFLIMKNKMTGEK